MEKTEFGQDVQDQKLSLEKPNLKCISWNNLNIKYFKWYSLAEEQQADEETGFQDFRKHTAIHEKKQRNKPSVKQNLSVSFKETGEALNKQYNYILLNNFIFHKYRTIIESDIELDLSN